MSNFSYSTTSPSPKRNTFIFANMDCSDSPLRSPTNQKGVTLGAINEDQEFNGSSFTSACLSMPLLRRSPTMQSAMMNSSMTITLTDEHYVEQQQTVEQQQQQEGPIMSYATNESIRDTHDIDASKLTQVPAPSATSKKAKRSKHRRSTCVFM